ncbi:PREDICTED: uncharacterized protein C4orf50 homolog [Gavialis gangeticus]|uniref:uncharacterized protein C4orf50 homolog n=1 Tax=Gavialis gangeticus TaxID=94835 RepID=UPI00092F4F65|nr:PREDICTED: uncharacterized protein C4orf50 homolog [Gavialis gangeticus]
MNYNRVNDAFLSNSVCHLVKRRASGKDSAAPEETAADQAIAIFRPQGENYDLEKCLQNKIATQKSTDENKKTDKEATDEKIQHKKFTGKSEREEEGDEKAQKRKLVCVPEEASIVLINITYDETEEKVGDSEFHIHAIQDDQNIDNCLKEIEEESQENPALKEEDRKHLEICISEKVNEECLEENIRVTEEKGKQPEKLVDHIEAYLQRNAGLKKESEQSLKLRKLENKRNASYKHMAAQREECCKNSQKLSLPKEDKWLYPLTILSPGHESSACLSKDLAVEEDYNKYVLYPSAAEVNNGCASQIHRLEEVVDVYSQRISTLMQEKEDYVQKLCMLQKESNDYAQKMCALEEEIDAYSQYILVTAETNIHSSKQLPGNVDLGDKYNNILDESETFSKNLSHVDKEEDRSSVKEMPVSESSKLFKNFLTLNEKKIRYFQLLSTLKEERNRYFKEIAKLVQDREKYLEKNHELEEKCEGNLQKISQLEGDKNTLLENVSELTREQEKCITIISELKACKTKSYQTISDLQEEKLVLKKDMDRIQKETSEQLLEYQKANENLTLENRELKELISDVGISYEKLKKDKILGRKGNMQNLSQENKSLQHQMQAKEMGTVISKAHMEEKGIQIGEPSNDLTRKQKGPYLEKGSAPESYSVMQELERAKEELKIQQTELEKAKKEAQKWYRELGFADARYEEVKTNLTQTLSELNQLKQANGAKMFRKQCCTLMTEHAVNETQDSKEDKIAQKRLEQQVLTLKSQLRDQAMLQTQFQDLQREVELLQVQLSEKTEELQKKKTEADLTVAPLKAKLACLVRKCHERNSLITRLVRKLHRPGTMDSVLSEEAKDLVNDTVLADYLFTFTPAHDQKRASQQIIVPEKTEYNQASQTSLPSEEDHDLSLCGSLNSRVCTTAANFQPLQEMPQTAPPVLLCSDADTSWVNGLPHNHGMYHAEVTEEERPSPGSFQREADDIHCFRTTRIKCTTSPLKLTSPERIIALHRELRQNHRSNYQIPPFNSFSSNLKADCSLWSHGQDATSWDTRSKVNNTLNFSERRPSHAIKERDHLLQCDDVFQSQTGNQHAGAVPQGRKKKNAIMSNTWISREKTDGSNSATAAKSYLSDMLSASNKGRNPVGKKSDALERVKSSEMKQGLPIPVGLVNIIKTIGESTMLLGWERPVLDELGCSNGHFITGYRICINGKFHKFVASSACTKTILENLDLSVPFQISVQTVGSSGLVSEKKNVQFSCPLTDKEAASFASSDYSEEQKPDVSSQEVVATTCITNGNFLSYGPSCPEKVVIVFMTSTCLTL